MASAADSRESNTRIWEGIYGAGHRLNYPSENFVRAAHHLFTPASHPAVLDYGFGSGENSIHLARRGHRICGVEVSAAALATATSRFAEAGMAADLRLMRDGVVPFDDRSVDLAVAWEVLSYNDWTTLPGAIGEIERVVRPGGLVLATLTAPGHLQDKISEPLGNNLRRIQSGAQAGATILVVPRERIEACFPGRKLAIGEFGYSFMGTDIHCWIVSYSKGK